MRVTNYYAWSEMTLVEQGELREKAAADLAALREAGEKMAERLRSLLALSQEADVRGNDYYINASTVFTEEDAAALAEWEAANK